MVYDNIPQPGNTKTRYRTAYMAISLIDFSTFLDNEKEFNRTWVGVACNYHNILMCYFGHSINKCIIFLEASGRNSRGNEPGWKWLMFDEDGDLNKVSTFTDIYDLRSVYIGRTNINELDIHNRKIETFLHYTTNFSNEYIPYKPDLNVENLKTSNEGMSIYYISSYDNKKERPEIIPSLTKKYKWGDPVIGELEGYAHIYRNDEKKMRERLKCGSIATRAIPRYVHLFLNRGNQNETYVFPNTQNLTTNTRYIPYKSWVFFLYESAKNNGYKPLLFKKYFNHLW